jgi:hypothetical protein
MLKLNQSKLLLLGLGFIFLFYLCNRLSIIISSGKVQGTFVFYINEAGNVEMPSDNNLFFPIFEYRMKDSVYQFQGRENSSYVLHEKVDILLEGKDPDRPLLYTWSSFWLYPFLYWILPVIVWSAFSLSYINDNERLSIDLNYPFFIKQKINSPIIGIRKKL